jgi:hypothetical protein
MARRPAASISSTLFRYLVWSMTSASPTACPHCELPAPRGRIGTPSAAAMAIAPRTASSVRGTTTPTGSTW